MSTEKTVNTAALQRALKVGAANGQSVQTLHFLLDTTERAVRKLVDELIEEGVPVCAHPAHGYYIAETWEEVEATYDWLRSRGLHSLAKASKLRAAFMSPANAGDGIPLRDTDRGADPMTQLEESGAFA